MSLKQKIILITVIIISIIILIFVNVWSTSKSESDGIKLYAEALEYYKADDFHKAYKAFANIPNRSVLKPAAIYRQAKCADAMQSDKLVQKHYKQLIRKYPDFTISIRIKYLLAQNVYRTSPKKAKKQFQNIIKKYPKSEYAIASKYYLGLIQITQLEGITNPTKLAIEMQKAEDYFKDYLKDAPAGRFAVYSINKIIDLGQNKLSADDNLIIARSYYQLGESKLAAKYFDRTNMAFSWTDIAKNYYELKNYKKMKEITENGIAKYSSYVDKKDVYKAIDLYLNVSSGNKSSALAYLSSISMGRTGEDYLKYLTCMNTQADLKDTCYYQLYNNFPNGQFAADALSNIIFSNIKYKRYQTAMKLGKEHLSKFHNVNSTPFVLFWMGKVEEDLKNYEASREYYKKVLNDYPDSYYAYRAYVNMYRIQNSVIATDLLNKPVVFPYEHSKNGDMVIKLALLKDYGLVNELCKNDKFVQSWLEYEKGNYNKSVVLARDAMEKLAKKPPKTDFRWRLVYPIHYYDLVQFYSLGNNPLILLSIIKEESHFDAKAKSSVGARGLMQLMPQTANEIKKSYGIVLNTPDYLYVPKNNIQIGSMYFSKLKKMNDGDEFLSILSYNGGYGMVNLWINEHGYYDKDEFLEQVPFPETQNYLKKVYKAYWNYARIYSKE